MSSPLTLYRRILRLHKAHLPPSLRSLGDSYLRSEFRLHKSVTDQPKLTSFLTEWSRYASKLESDAASLSSDPKSKSDWGESLADVELTHDQLQQLKKMHEEATKIAGIEQEQIDSSLGDDVKVDFNPSSRK